MFTTLYLQTDLSIDNTLCLLICLIRRQPVHLHLLLLQGRMYIYGKRRADMGMPQDLSQGLCIKFHLHTPCSERMPQRVKRIILYPMFLQIILIPDIELMRLGIFSLPGQQIELGFSPSAFKIFSEKSRQRNRTDRVLCLRLA